MKTVESTVFGNLDLRTIQGDTNKVQQEIDQRTQHMLQLGFSSDWIHELQQRKSTLFQVENIDAKIAGLTERGFPNPQKMIASSPAILGYAFENIDAKIALINRLSSHYTLEVSAPALMQQENALFCSKIDKLWVLARIARDVGGPSILSSSSLRKLLYANLECVVIAQYEIEQKTFTALMHRVREMKARGDGREEKREQIAAISNTDSIARRYLRGYPIKK